MGEIEVPSALEDQSQSFSPSWEAGPRPDETKGRFRVWISAVYFFVG